MTYRHLVKGRKIFPCECCGKLTRQTDTTSGTNLCLKCYEESMKEIEIVDGIEEPYQIPDSWTPKKWSPKKE